MESNTFEWELEPALGLQGSYVKVRGRRLDSPDFVVIYNELDCESVSCHTVAGDHLGTFLIPSGMMPYYSWLAGEVLREACISLEDFKAVQLLDSEGHAFYSQPIFACLGTCKKVYIEEEEEASIALQPRDVQLLHNISHPNVLGLMDIVVQPCGFELVFDRIDADLRNVVRKSKAELPKHQVSDLLRQVLAGTKYLHACSVVHRNITPCNIFVDTPGNKLRLGCIGFGRLVTPLWYRAVEILLDGRSGPPMDVWSSGCVFAYMVSGNTLFPGDSEIGTIFEIFKLLGTPTAQECPRLVSLPEFQACFPSWRRKNWTEVEGLGSRLGLDGVYLLECMLMYDPMKRISARKALQFEYFSSVDDVRE
eukprot:TRINITY_DN25133_c0_g1_i1.p1 TRINITY_DN25133_c0_g1~~TRINITY_DN25133_c0_g1_i1.p1  ORF type:complete len:377 (+),score=27.65 TRINITY_DN25133_c0_g1_i1:38-1132(+)